MTLAMFPMTFKKMKLVISVHPLSASTGHQLGFKHTVEDVEPFARPWLTWRTPLTASSSPSSLSTPPPAAPITVPNLIALHYSR